MTLESQIEAILFFKGESVTLSYLEKTLEKSTEEIATALAEFKKSLEGRGLVLVQNGEEISLGTSPDASPIIEKITKDELTRDLGKAGLETLSIVLYKGPVSRREIDYIRGVNSQFILRNLLIRGLVEKTPSPSDQRTFLYAPTIDLIKFMGITSADALPEYESMRKQMEETPAQSEPQE